MQLNKKKPYAVVYGISACRYEQDGKQFDGQGNLVGGTAAPPVGVSNLNPDPKPSETVKTAAPVPPPEVPTAPPIEVPDLSMDLPLKYTAHMNIDEMKAELDTYGIDYAPAIKAAEEKAAPRKAAIKPLLEDMIDAERKARGL